MSHGGGSFDGWLARVHPEDRERFARDVEAFLSSPARQGTVEYRLRAAGGEGEYVPVQERLVVERSEDGEPVRLVSMVEEREAPSPEGPRTRLGEFFRNTGDAVFQVDARGRLGDFSPAFAELLELTPDEARGRRMVRYYRDPDDRATLVRDLRREGRVADRELHLVATDGSPRVVLGSAVAVLDGDGAYAGHQAIVHDITARCRREEELRQRAERLERRVGALRALYAISERLAGAEALDRELLEDVVALIPGGLGVPEHARARVVLGSTEVAASGFDAEGASSFAVGREDQETPRGSVAVSYLTSAGQQGTSRSLGEEEGRFLEEVAKRLSGAVCRMDALEDRRRDEAYHRLLVERSQDLLAILDAEATIRFASPAAERLLGYAPGSLVGENALELVHPDDRDAAEVAVASAVRDPERTPTMEHRVRHADGSWRHFESTGRSFLEDPEIRGIVVNCRDVTVRKGLEEQLRHVQKMEAVARLAGGVAHEFNNLLTVIRVSTRLLEEHFEGPRRPEELDDIEDATAAAAVLTRRLLAFSGRDISRPRLLDLAAVIREVEPYLTRTAGDDIELVVELPGAPLPVRADALQIEQVVLNLFDNALEALPEGGRVVLQARTAGPDDLPSQVRRPDQWAVLRVVDSGSGVPEEIQDTIFEPFFTTREGGTGLGLATVRTVVSRLGGFVEVGRAPDGGASFTVCFPRGEREDPLRGEPTPDDRLDFPKGRTILVVEGDAASRSLVERVLSGEGYRVLEAHDGVSALTLLEAYGGPLDLLVTAGEMPHVTGPELAARVLATHPDVGVLYLVDEDRGPSYRPFVRRDGLSQRLTSIVEGTLESEQMPVVEPTE